eukprot:gene1499-2892_t
MLAAEKVDDDAENMMSESATLLEGGRTGNEQPEIPFCGCLSIRYYQPFFDVDTTDIGTRLLNAVFFCRRETPFVALINEKPDAYGPFWISTTLVFTIAVTSHINSWLSSWIKGNTWEYDFQSVVTVASLIYGFMGMVPVSIWFVLRQLDAKLICLAPSELVSWLALLGAAALSSVFLLRNLAPVFVLHARQQAPIMLGVIGFTQLVLTLSLKFCFYNNTTE